MSDLFTQPMTIAAIALPLLVAFIIHFKSGADRWWWTGLFIGSFVFWGFIVLASNHLEADLAKAARAVIGEADEIEPRSQFNSNLLKSYGFTIGLLLTGAYYAVFTIFRGASRKLSQ